MDNEVVLKSRDWVRHALAPRLLLLLPGNQLVTGGSPLSIDYDWQERHFDRLYRVARVRATAANVDVDETQYLEPQACFALTFLLDRHLKLNINVTGFEPHFGGRSSCDTFFQFGSKGADHICEPKFFFVGCHGLPPACLLRLLSKLN